MINSIGSQNYAVQQTSEVKNSVVPPTAQETKSSGYVRHGWDNFIPDVEADPLFAKEMAEAVAFIPDKLMINLNDAPHFLILQRTRIGRICLKSLIKSHQK